MHAWRILAASLIGSLLLLGCAAQLVDSEDIWGDIRPGQNYAPASRMIDGWYAVEAIDERTFAINEPKSEQYNTSYLIVGSTRAIMFDAGCGERPAGSKSMREVAGRLTDKPVTLILSHHHYDHTGDAATFEDGVTLVDRPEIRARIDNGRYTIGALESGGAVPPPLKIAGFVKDGDTIDLGDRQLSAYNLPGHTNESVVLVDRVRNLAFTGDHVYQHLGGIVAMTPQSDLPIYKANVDRLLALTDAKTRYLGAHGDPHFDRAWVSLIDSELGKMVAGTATYRYASHYLVPGKMPLRVLQNGDLYIYTTPLVDPSLFWSKWSLLAIAAALSLALYLVARLFRRLRGGSRSRPET